MEVIEWNDRQDKFKITKNYGDFSTEFVFVVDHIDHKFKLERAKKVFTIGSFDISPSAMESVFTNIIDDAIEIYLNYWKKLNDSIVPQIVPQLVRGTSIVPQGICI